MKLGHYDISNQEISNLGDLNSVQYKYATYPYLFKSFTDNLTTSNGNDLSFIPFSHWLLHIFERKINGVPPLTSDLLPASRNTYRFSEKLIKLDVSRIKIHLDTSIAPTGRR